MWNISHNFPRKNVILKWTLNYIISLIIQFFFHYYSIQVKFSLIFFFIFRIHFFNQCILSLLKPIYKFLFNLVLYSKSRFTLLGTSVSWNKTKLISLRKHSNIFNWISKVSTFLFCKKTFLLPRWTRYM